jgi:hypothetical protein
MDTTCFIYEEKIMTALVRSKKILKKLRKKMPKSDEYHDLKKEHAKLWVALDILIDDYSNYRNCD